MNPDESMARLWYHPNMAPDWSVRGGRSSGGRTEEEAVLLETLDELELPRRMLGRWFSHNRTFCEKHGGRRVYPGLLELLDRCDQALAKTNARSLNPGSK